MTFNRSILLIIGTILGVTVFAHDSSAIGEAKSAVHLKMIQDSLANLMENADNQKEKSENNLSLFRESMGLSSNENNAGDVSKKHLALIQDAFKQGPIPYLHHSLDQGSGAVEIPFLEMLKHHKHHHNHHHHNLNFGLFSGQSKFSNRPKVILEVIKVNERIIVDEKDQPKGILGADVKKSFYSMRHGRLHPIMSMNTSVRPRDGKPIMFAAGSSVHIDEPRVIGNDKEGCGSKGRKFKFEEFFPRLMASIFLGFVATVLLYLLAYGALSLYAYCKGEILETAHYTSVNDDDSPDTVTDRNSSTNEKLLSREEKRVEMAAPAVPNV